MAQSLHLPFTFEIEASKQPAAGLLGQVGALLQPAQRVRKLTKPVTFTIDFSDLPAESWGFGVPQLFFYDEDPTELANGRTVAATAPRRADRQSVPARCAGWMARRSRRHRHGGSDNHRPG